MKQLLVILWLLALLHLDNSEDSFDSEEVSEIKRNLQIERIRINGDQHFMKVSTRIYEDRKHFDIYIMLSRKLGSNYLIMNLNMRVKFEGAKDFVKIIELKRMDFCTFLNNPSFRDFFMSAVEMNHILECPIRVNNYSILNIDVFSMVRPEEMVKGTYKFYTDVVEVTGDTPKVFALQVTTILK